MCTYLESPAFQKCRRTWSSLQSLLKQVVLSSVNCLNATDVYQKQKFQEYLVFTLCFCQSETFQKFIHTVPHRILSDLLLNPGLSTWVLGFTSADELSTRITHQSTHTITQQAPSHHLLAQLFTIDVFLPEHQTESLYRSQYVFFYKKTFVGISVHQASPDIL